MIEQQRQRRWNWLLALVALVGVCRSALAQEHWDAKPPAAVASAPTAEQIETWITDLDSDRYRVREEATQQLLQVVRDGSAAPLDPLLAAANGGRPEQEDRAVWILRQLIDVNDLELRRQVLEHLAEIKDRPQVIAEAVQGLAQIRHDFAVRAIEKLGGQFKELGRDTQWMQDMPRRVVLTDEWRGGDDGLKLLADLNEVPLVMIFGTNITADGLAQLSTAPSIQQLKLYGTEVSDIEVEKLRARLPGIDIDYRRGGFLGVIGVSGANVAIVQTVQPNTAAAVAGLLPQDQIQKFNGQAVSNFEMLTREIAKHGPGDEVSLEIVRDGTPKEVKLKLGKWQSP